MSGRRVGTAVSGRRVGTAVSGRGQQCLAVMFSHDRNWHNDRLVSYCGVHTWLGNSSTAWLVMLACVCVCVCVCVVVDEVT